MRAEAAAQFDGERVASELERHVRSVGAASAELSELAARHPAVGVVCYGVGSASLSSEARVQIACAVALARAWAAPLQLFEPLLCDAEAQLLRDRFAIDVLTANDEGRRVVAQRTIFFMPHCPRGLYHNLVQTNARAGSLPNVVLIGNSFAQYDLMCAADARTLVEALADRCTLEPLPPRLVAAAGDALGSLAIHTFTEAALDGIDCELLDAACGDAELVSAAATAQLSDSASPQRESDCS